MAERWRVRKGDQVIVISGSHKGKVGEVERVLRAERKVIVKGVNVVKRHTRPTPMQPGGIIEKELPIHVSNVAHLDSDSGKPTRVGVKVLDGGQKARFAKRSGTLIDK